MNDQLLNGYDGSELKSTEDLIAEVTQDENEQINLSGNNNNNNKPYSYASMLDPKQLFRYEGCITPEVIIKQNESQIFFMFEAKGIDMVLNSDILHYY